MLVGEVGHIARHRRDRGLSEHVRELEQAGLIIALSVSKSITWTPARTDSYTPRAHDDDSRIRKTQTTGLRHVVQTGHGAMGPRRRLPAVRAA